MPFTEAQKPTASLFPRNPSHKALFAKLGINLGACLLSTCLLAQTTNPPPLQGAVDPVTEQRRQLERDNALRERQERGVDIKPENTLSPPSNRLPTGETPCFSIRQLQLRGDDAARFDWVLANVDGGGLNDSPIGKCLGAQGIDLVLQRAQDSVIARGFVTTRILAEPQDLKTGELMLTVLSGRIRNIRFAADVSNRASYFNAIPAKPGDLLNLRDIEQGLENFKRAPTAEADIKIEPAAGPDGKPGYSDLVISYQQPMPFRLGLSADDSGSKGTGKYQGGITFSYDNWWTLNDLFYVSVNHGLGGGGSSGRGTSAKTAHYSVPFGYWLLSGTASSSSYFQTVAGATQDYVYSGTSDNTEAKLSRLVHRNAQSKTTLSVRAFQRKSNNFIDDTEVLVQQRVVGGWEASANHRAFIGPATLDAGLTYKRGTGAFGALPAPEEAFGEGTSRFALVTGDVSLAAPFQVGTQKLRYSGSWRIQNHRTPLTPQDRFAVGGRFSVRGFDGESSLSAERGWLIRNELSVAVGQSGQEAFAALDHGEVGGPSADLLVGRRLTGAVVGLRGGYKKWQYDIFLGGPVRKPDNFRTSHRTAGFSMNLGF